MEREGRRTRSSLRSAENLSLPQVQVIVISANMECSHCRQRVSKLLSKMNKGLLDYVVDLKKKQATVRGVVEENNKKRRADEGKSSNKSKTSHSFGLRQCFGAFSSEQ